MEREKISQEIANQYVLDVLESYIDISEDANILTSIMNNEATYELNDTKMVNNTPTKRVIPLKTKEYFAILRHALSRKGYNHCYIKPIIRNETIQYEVSFQITQEYSRRGRWI